MKNNHLFACYWKSHLIAFMKNVQFALGIARLSFLGAVHKVRHARGGRGSEDVWRFVTGGGGQEHVTSRLYKFLSYIWNMKFKVMFNFLL